MTIADTKRCLFLCLTPLVFGACGDEEPSAPTIITVSGTINYPGWDMGNIVVNFIQAETTTVTIAGGTSASYSVEIEAPQTGLVDTSMNAFNDVNGNGTPDDYEPLFGGVVSIGQADVVHDFALCARQDSGCVGMVIAFDAPALGASAKVNAYIYDGSTLVGSCSDMFLDAGGKRICLPTNASADGVAVTPDTRDFVPAAQQTYQLVVISDASDDNIVSGDADDLNHLGSFSGVKDVVRLDDSHFSQFVEHDVTITGDATVAGEDVVCFFHFPGLGPQSITGDIVQRFQTGFVVDTLDGSGSSSGSAVSFPAVQGQLDVTCVTMPGGYAVADGVGVTGDSKYVTAAGETIDGSGSAVSGFVPIP